jgi:hypothetical protein
MVINVQKIMIMKKEYINPDMQVIKISTVQLLADSNMGFGGPASTLDAPSFDWDDEDEDEY